MLRRQQQPQQPQQLPLQQHHYLSHPPTVEEQQQHTTTPMRTLENGVHQSLWRDQSSSSRKKPSSNIEAPHRKVSSSGSRKFQNRDGQEEYGSRGPNGCAPNIPPHLPPKVSSPVSKQGLLSVTTV